MRRVIAISLIALVGLLGGTATADARKKPKPPVVPPTEQPAPRCQPGYGPFGGKDGDESEPYHNDECCPDADSNQRCDDVVRPGQTTVNSIRFYASRAI